MEVDMMKDLVLPVIHLNGTDRATLLEGYSALSDAIIKATEAFLRAGFHPRDYYVISDEAIRKASEQRMSMLERLKDLQKYADAHVNHLYE